MLVFPQRRLTGSAADASFGAFRFLCFSENADLTDPVVRAELSFTAERVEDGRAIRQETIKSGKMPVGILPGHRHQAQMTASDKLRQSVFGIRNRPQIDQRIQLLHGGQLQIGAVGKRTGGDQPLIQDSRIKQGFLLFFFNTIMTQHDGERADQTVTIPKKMKIRLRKQRRRPRLGTVKARIGLPPAQIVLLHSFIPPSGYRQPDQHGKLIEIQRPVIFHFGGKPQNDRLLQRICLKRVRFIESTDRIVSRAVDIWASEIVLRLRDEGKPIHLICASPFEGFERRWSNDWKQRYNDVIQRADTVKFICSRSSRSCFQIRNEWMVDHSARVIAVLNGTAGGTKNTVEYSKKNNTVELHYINS